MITGWLVVGYRVVTGYFGVVTGWLRVVSYGLVMGWLQGGHWVVPQSGLRYIVSYIFHLSKHLNLVRCLVLAPGHVAEVDQIPDGWHNWVEEEAEAQQDEEVPSS